MSTSAEKTPRTWARRSLNIWPAHGWHDFSLSAAPTQVQISSRNTTTASWPVTYSYFWPYLPAPQIRNNVTACREVCRRLVPSSGSPLILTPNLSRSKPRARRGGALLRSSSAAPQGASLCSPFVCDRPFWVQMKSQWGALFKRVGTGGHNNFTTLGFHFLLTWSPTSSPAISCCCPWPIIKTILSILCML